ncbi:hypothetical protein INH39_28145 [Massilia violaceinigra]|uniref:Hydrogenase n=1 Tax=Massilia violaceinigra TaxID=2045208 RepID=A0ABY4A5G3_9BURK|nr:hypothetical protein [Massilia violaceinigra]UOD29244.1 hypothetical protein INH39_28145 [Massilia violaceinigra]
MNAFQIAITVAIILPGMLALAAAVFYTVRYMRVRRGRKDTLVDYLHDFTGGLFRLIARADPPEEQYYFRRMMLAGVLFFAYITVIMAVAG